MPRGQIVDIPTGTGQLITTLSREEKESLAILNPNDGVVYIKLNGSSKDSPTLWDWKLPSQSYGQFPGPWQSLGLYYVDQSGSGRFAELNIYESDSQLAIPQIVAIGRAVQQAGTNVDITQGGQPQNPPSGTSRLWIDANNNLHVLQSNGTDQQEIDTNDIAGGVLTGTYPNPQLGNGVVQLANMAANSVGSAQIVDSSIATADIGDNQITNAKLNGAIDRRPYSISGADIRADRGNNSGYYFFANSAKYLGWAQGGGFSWNTEGDDIYIGGSRITGMMNASLDYQHLINGTISSQAVQTSDGSTYTLTTTGTNSVVPGMTAPLTVNLRSGICFVAGQLYCGHSAGSYLSIYCILDGAYQWLGQELVAAGAQTQLQFATTFSLTAGSHTFALGWSTSSPGTATRYAWLSRLSVLELSR